jgi:cellulose biosynthesis protein BcsQ
MVALSVASAFLFAGKAVLAVDLDNNDSRAYQVKIRTGSTLNSSINGKSIQKNVCSGNCEIEVVGVGTAKVSGNMTVVINGGRLSVRK